MTKHHNGIADLRYSITPAKRSIDGELIEVHEIRFLNKFVDTALSYDLAVEKAQEHNKNRF